jgi:hypothetical protein
MSAVPVWAVPYQFTVTNPYSGFLELNVQLADRLYALDQQACKMRQAVRATVDHVPQSDGDILHHRFLTGVQMVLAIQLWENATTPACDDLLAEMLDEVTGSFRSLLNTVDNDGRISWEVPGQNDRMLDDLRLLVYPEQVVGNVLTTVVVTVDTAFPYAQDLTQQNPTVSDGGSTTITNTGTADYYPVYLVSKAGGTSAFTITNAATGEAFTYSGTTIPNGSYLELNSFNNTAFLNGDGADLLDGVDIQTTLFPLLQIGGNLMSITGADMEILWAPAWG